MACLLAMGFSGQVLPASHALLVGISDYQRPVPTLEGPVHDVKAVERVLRDRWSLSADNITVLLDSQASKAAILQAIETLYQRSAAGDYVFIYLSGHGTSALDAASRFSLPTTSGAYIPYDMGRPQSKQEYTQRLLIGRTDLQPLFKRLDQGGREVMVVIDACYSGNTVRGAYSHLQFPTRQVDARDILPSRAFGDDLGGSSGFGQQTREQPPYPYDNIFYFGASGEHEIAADISGQMLARHPTIDGRPHGAFTDAFLRAMSGQLAVDANNNGYLSYGELYQGIRTYMSGQSYGHTPSRLPSLAEDEMQLTERSVFGRKAPPGTADLLGPFTVDVGPERALVKPLQAAGITLVEANAVVNVDRRDGLVTLVSASGDQIARMQQTSEDALVDQLLAQRAIHEWVRQPIAQQFNLSVSLQGTAVGSTLAVGDQVGFTMRASEPAYLVVINIGPTGNMSVLYPAYEAEVVAIPAGELMALRDLADVHPPFGREIVDVIAFDDVPKELQDFMGKSFAIRSAEARDLRELLQNPDYRKARAWTAVYTAR